jgi:sigma-B regulation protein RsbU (phosphoserine phosphatase)
MHMNPQNEEIQRLRLLNRIAETLNQASDVRTALQSTLPLVVDLMGLETGWVFLIDPADNDLMWGQGFHLAAHFNLPPALDLDHLPVWHANCDCQGLCLKGKLNQAYNEVRCSRLAASEGDRRQLSVHASAPLNVGGRTLGILNVAAENWSEFSPQSLALLTNIASQIGTALERARLFDILRDQRVDEQAALLELSKQLLASRSLQELMAFIVEKVRSLIDADACSLILAGSDTEWLEFRAASGWKRDPVAADRRVPDDKHSGPGRVMRTQEPLIVEDIQSHDPTPWTPKWLLNEGFRGHAVLPLVVDDHSIGTMAIDFREARVLSEDELRLVQLMANQAAIAIETARLSHEEFERQRLEEELSVGRQIQLSLLPRENPTLPGWDFAAINQVARQVGGDFYDFFKLPGESDRLGMVIADVSDKGVPAALFMALSRTMIRSTALSGRSPAQALTRANELILNDSRTDLFVSAFYAVLEAQSGRFSYACAGHNRPLCLRASQGKVETVKARGTILGAFEDITMEDREMRLHPEDVLLLYTDGATEALDHRGRFFGENRLRKVLRGQVGADAETILHAVLEAIDTFTGAVPRTDDLTLIVARRLAG